MKRKTIIILIVVVNQMTLSMIAQSQRSWSWVEHIGSRGWDQVAGMVCDGKNNIYLAGNFTDTLYTSSSDKVTSSGQDMFIVKYNDQGRLKYLWTGGGQHVDKIECLAISANEQLYFGGQISDSAVLGNINIPGIGKRLFVACMSDKNKVLWISTLNVSGDATLSLIEVGVDGSIIASGTFTGVLSSHLDKVTSNGRRDIFVAQFESNGNQKRFLSFGGEEDDIPSAMTLDPKGNVYLSGNSASSFSIGDEKISKEGTPERPQAFIIQFDNNLSLQGRFLFEGAEFVKVSSMKADSLGSVYTCGSYNTTMTISGTTLTAKGYTDIFVTRHDNTLRPIMIKSIGSDYYDYASQLHLVHVNGIMLTGTLGDTLQIDDISLFPKTSSNSTLALQITNSGTVIWGDCISGQVRNFSDASVLDANGNLYLAGSFSGSFEKGYDEINSYGDQDIFIARYQKCLHVEDVVQGDHFICPGGVSTLYVNAEYTNILWSNGQTNTYHIVTENPGVYSVSVYDKNGCLMTDSIDVKSVNPLKIYLGPDTAISIHTSYLLKVPVGYSSYQWQDNSTGNTFLASSPNNEPGTIIYWVEVTDSTGCSSHDSIRITFFESIPWADPERSDLYIYPNPVNDQLTWRMNVQEICQFDLEITDNYGKLVISRHIANYSGDSQTISFGNLPIGPYFLQVKDKNGRISKSVCVIRQ